MTFGDFPAEGRGRAFSTPPMLTSQPGKPWEGDLAVNCQQTPGPAPLRAPPPPLLGP